MKQPTHPELLCLSTSSHGGLLPCDADARHCVCVCRLESADPGPMGGRKRRLESLRGVSAAGRWT